MESTVTVDASYCSHLAGTRLRREYTLEEIKIMDWVFRNSKALP